MLNAVYRLVAPRRFEIGFDQIDLNTNEVLVRPTYLSICNADQRYYQGLRPPEILKSKLPMSLIHESIGEVLHDGDGIFQVGERVIMIPNYPVESDSVIGKNYLRSSRFRASGMDGFLQENLLMSGERLVKIPENFPNDVLAFSEFVSVSIHAINRFSLKAHSRRDKIGIWGDGNLGYVTALLLRYLYPNAELIVFGVNESKLEKFTFVEHVYLTTNSSINLEVDHAFECVGGNSAHMAINQIIDYIRPEGTISILGVSEYLVPLNTRMILEKGIQIFGSSRSEREDFERVVAIYEKYPEIVQYLRILINREIEVRTVHDIILAFEEDIRKEYGKTVLKWEI